MSLNQLIPLASYFVNIGAASPFFRTEELKIYHKDLMEVPWMEETYLSANGAPILDKGEIREGTFIRFFDPSLIQQTQGADSPELYGLVHQFIGYTPTHVAALIDILTFYRFGRLMSYNTGQIIHPSLRLKEQTIVLITRPRCHFELEPLLQFKPVDMEVDITHTLFREQKVVAWGPKRDWPNWPNWRRELRKTAEERDRERRCQEGRKQS